MVLEFIDTSLIRYILPFNGINPHSVIILDNAAIYHVDIVVDTLQSLGVLVPPYSLDLNPIEEAFSKMKTYLRANDAAIQAENSPDDEKFKQEFRNN